MEILSYIERTRIVDTNKTAVKFIVALQLCYSPKVSTLFSLLRPTSLNKVSSLSLGTFVCLFPFHKVQCKRRRERRRRLSAPGSFIWPASLPKRLVIYWRKDWDGWRARAQQTLRPRRRSNSIQWRRRRATFSLLSLFLSQFKCCL